MKTPRFQIGTVFTRYYGKHRKPETITDILTTTNSSGEVVKICYVTAHDLCGQIVKDYDVPEFTIARSLAQ